VLDVRAVPERLDDGVGEAEVQQVLHRLLAEEMIDAKIKIDIPFPTPRSVINSPNHMISAVPAVITTTMVNNI
jgi:hypothetical protein